MKPPRNLAILTAALLCAAPPQSSPAADVAVDISSFAPRNPEVLVMQIELNASIKQLEKVLMDLHEAELQRRIGPSELGLTDQQRKEWEARAELKLQIMEITAARLRAQIRELVMKADAVAKEIEKVKKEKAEPKTGANPPMLKPLT